MVVSHKSGIQVTNNNLPMPDVNYGSNHMARTREEAKRHKQWEKEKETQQKIDESIERAMTSAGKCEKELHVLKAERDNARLRMVYAHSEYRHTKRLLEEAETNLQRQRDRYREIVDTVHDQMR